MSLQNIIKEDELIKDAEYLGSPEAEVMSDSVRLTALIIIAQKIPGLISSRETAAYRAGVERAREIVENFPFHIDAKDVNAMRKFLSDISQELKDNGEGK